MATLVNLPRQEDTAMLDDKVSDRQRVGFASCFVVSHVLRTQLSVLPVLDDVERPPRMGDFLDFPSVRCGAWSRKEGLRHWHSKFSCEEQTF